MVQANEDWETEKKVAPHVRAQKTSIVIPAGCTEIKMESTMEKE